MHDAKKPSAVALMQRPQWDDIRVFLAIVDAGSLRAASRPLALNVSTVSRRLAALEAALGARLFERHPDGLKLTAMGEEVASLGERVNEDVWELCRRVGGHDERLEGTVRLTAAEVVGPILCQALGDFVREHPGLSIELSVTDTMARLDRHEVDLAVRVAEQPPEQLVGRRVAHCGVGLYASRGYVERHGSDPRTKGHAWIAWPRAVEQKPALRWVEHHFPARHTAMRLDSASGVLQAVRSGLGIAALGHAQAADDPVLVRLRRLPDDCATPVWVLFHREVRHTARVRALSDALCSALADRGKLLKSGR